MGVAVVHMKIRKSKGAKRFAEKEFLVDSGAAFTVAPATVLKRLGIEPDERQDFFLANGEKVTCKVGDAYFEFGDKAGYSKVIFGQRGDSNLLGVLTLEMFGLVLDPFKRERKAMPMTRMANRPARRLLGTWPC